MTKKELTDSYLKRYNLKITVDSYDAILPFLLMDLAYQQMNRLFADNKPVHEMRRHYKSWLRIYKKFNSLLFETCKGKEDEYIDIMDNFESHMNNHVEILRLSVMDLIKNEPMEVQTFLSTIEMCKVLTIMSKFVWNKAYGIYMNYAVEMFEKLNYHAREIIVLYSKLHKSYIDFEGSKTITNNLNALCANMMRWLKQ